MASPTFSLPEYIGGTRNWDYRCVLLWMVVVVSGTSGVADMRAQGVVDPRLVVHAVCVDPSGLHVRGERSAVLSPLKRLAS